MSEGSVRIYDVFAKIAELHKTLGLPSLKEVGKPWEFDLDGGWHIAVNGSLQPVEIEPEGMMAFEVPPCEAAIWWNGWLAGSFHPIGGGWMAAGSGANEEALLGALTGAIAQEKSKAQEEA